LTTWPVTQAASSVQSQATSRAASSGSPQRPAGNIVATRSRVAWSTWPVSVGPGLMVFTVIPRSARVSARLAVTATSAPLEAA
jgi:hypothetical protein